MLTLIHLVGIPITNLSVNPARSIGPALFVGGWAIEQLWLFIVAPLLGALLGASVPPGAVRGRRGDRARGVGRRSHASERTAARGTTTGPGRSAVAQRPGRGAFRAASAFPQTSTEP